MKKLLISILAMTFLTCIPLSFAIDRELKSLDELTQQGMQIKLGELTGAGSSFSLNKLAGLILPEGVLMREDCTEIVVKTRFNPKISDIMKIKTTKDDILASSFLGFVIK